MTAGNNAAYRKFTKSDLVSFFLMMTETVGEETLTCLNVVMFFCSVLSFFSYLSTK